MLKIGGRDLVIDVPFAQSLDVLVFVMTEVVGTSGYDKGFGS
jgi:hypothetical protein